MSPIKSNKSRSATPDPPATEGDWLLQNLPFELQVRTLSYLRAHDLSAVHQVNQYTWQSVHLHHAIVVYCAEQVYPPKWTVGFQDQPISSSISTVTVTKSKGKANRARSKSRSSSVGSLDDAPATESSDSTSETTLYTFEHLRNMELLVVARVLSSPEPATGFVVSKSWCKTALCWLEGQQERLYHQQQQEQLDGLSKKKKSKKVKATKRAPNVAPPPANINSDITCSHDQLQHYTSTKSARARRRLLDKQAWRILKALYPESTPLPAHSGECLQCRAEACQALKAVTDQQEAAKQQRKLPLKDPVIRRFYTRTRGVPEDSLRGRARTAGNSDAQSDVTAEASSEQDQKPPALATPVKGLQPLVSCPLMDGVYYVLPRAWCHGWRHFMKTGEGGMSANSALFSPPDAASLLCDAHNLALLPPHLEAFLYGESSQLLEGSGSNIPVSTVASVSPAALPPGQGPTLESIQAMRLLGLSDNEISRQVSAMRSIEGQQQQLQREALAINAAAMEAAASVSRNELLDRENHSVVEILSQAEFRALTACWPGTNVFALRFTVQTSLDGVAAVAAPTGDALVCGGVNFCTPVCRSCDSTGRQCSMSIKNRARGWVKKSTEKSRSPASLEY
jgi:hypothetical protein